MLASILLFFALLLAIGNADERWIEGWYRNPALGYAVNIPRSLKGLAGDQAGPERGVRVALSSGGSVTVYGEPNSLEWKSPAEGVQWDLSHEDCPGGERRVSAARIGRLMGAEGTLRCGDRILKWLLAFRPGGGPIYWLRLETVNVHENGDDAILRQMASTLPVIRWE